MARRISRRPRVVWLPQDGFFSVDSATADISTVNRATENVLGPDVGASFTLIAPVVTDISPNPIGAANSLADINNSGYRLRRIVGKIWVFATQTGVDNPGPGAAVVTASFIVLRTDPTTATLPQNPDSQDYSANDRRNAEAPWIWRRSWLVVNNGSVNSIPFGDNSTNELAAYSRTPSGGVADGPHVDQKTARIIGPDERLFLVFTATSLTPADAQTPLTLDYVWDLRVLGSMKNMVGNRNNASR